MYLDLYHLLLHDEKFDNDKNRNGEEFFFLKKGSWIQ